MKKLLFGSSKKKKGGDGGPGMGLMDGSPLFGASPSPRSSAATNEQAPPPKEAPLKRGELGKGVDDGEYDARLERTVLGCMDYLANEGLNVPGLFVEPFNEDQIQQGMRQVLYPDPIIAAQPRLPRSPAGTDQTDPKCTPDAAHDAPKKPRPPAGSRVRGGGHTG
ncbi:hypothetical protein T484DRAFT_1757520 [Baffinella frigidus]|nr:hypothetical protein T484DRAFT_1757520 [Cryptophyta sp. CCMP2293]